MTLDVIIDDTRWSEAGLEPLAVGAVTRTLAQFGFDPDATVVAVLGCDDARISDFNADFRDKRQPTNVLSWPSEDRGAVEDGGDPIHPSGDELGDIAIAFDTCLREAMNQGKPMPEHVTHLLVHATLHLLGYDHTRPKDAQLMERLEIEILATLGIANPY
jgi:probable rRNA maturation factor